MSRASRVVDIALARLPARALSRVEEGAQLAQGKGWGTATVAAEVRAIRTMIATEASPPLVVLDIGANIGSWSVEALRQFPGAQVHAFEPSSHAFAELQRTLDGESRVTLHRFALGAQATTATLFADRPGSGLASLSARRLEHFGMTAHPQEVVQVTTLAQWCEAWHLDRADVVKMDVEGHELAVLHGAGDWLDRVRIVQFEFGGANIDTRTYWQDFWYLLSGRGFDLFRLTPRGPVLVPSYREADEVFRTTNYLAVRRGATAVVR